MTDEKVDGRTNLLHKLCGLRCTWDDATTSAAYIAQRAHLLEQLAAVAGPWCEEDKKLFALAMAEGENAMAVLVAQKRDVAARLRALQCRQRMITYPAAASASRPRRTY